MTFFKHRGHPVFYHFKCPSAVVVSDERRHFYSIRSWKAQVNLAQKFCLTVHVSRVATLSDKETYLLIAQRNSPFD
jgi:hypothetical protein